MLLKETIINQLPYFKTLQEKELFINVIGALTTRIISLSKACELLNMGKEVLLKFLDTIGIEYSYLHEADIKDEREW